MGSNPCREKTRWVDVFLTRLTVAINDPGKRRYAPADLLPNFLPVMATAEYPITKQRVTLGRSLFFDTRFSIDGNVGCVNCHRHLDLARGPTARLSK